MKYIKEYRIFEASDPIDIYGQTEHLSNIEILYDIRDILFDLSDIGIQCRMWVNGYTIEGGEIYDQLEEIEIEVNHENENIYLFNEVVERLKDFLNTIGWEAEVENNDGKYDHPVIKCNMYDYILIHPKGKPFERDELVNH